jgi:hypothetical protein
MVYTITEFASLKNITAENVRVMICRNKLPNGFTYLEDSKMIVGEDLKKTKYINPKNLSAEQIVTINNAFNNFAGNMQKVSDVTNINYTTCYNYFKNKYKEKGQQRADKGVSRALKNLSQKQIDEIKSVFEILLKKDAQAKVQLAIEKTLMNTGIKIPERLAYRWAQAFKAIHKSYHNPKALILKKGFHIIRDQWTEFQNFNDCVYADEWKVDEYGVWIHWKEEDYEKQRAVAYIVAFQDAKTRQVELVMTQNSVTTNDTIKACLNWVLKFGRPKKFVFENAKTWKNEQFLRFVLGLYDDNNTGIEFADYDRLMSFETTNDDVARTRVGRPEGKQIERVFRIIKDEFCAFSESYSPNPQESRKPEFQSSGPGVTRTFEDLRLHLGLFMEHDFVDRQRSMFQSRLLSPAHPDNKDRPKTIREAFENGYAYYTRVNVDEFRLAYLYAEKYNRKLNGLQFEFIYPTSKERMVYYPDDISAAIPFMDQKITLLVNQYNVYKGWFFVDGKMICGCTDLRLQGAVSKDQANNLGKANNELLRISKKHIKQLAEVEKHKKVYTFNYEKTLPEAVEPLDEFTNTTKDSLPVEDDDCVSIFEDESILNNSEN